VKPTFLLRTCLAGLFILLVACQSESPDIRIMTYNIRHGLGMDRVLDLERTAAVINHYHPDLLILNEVDQGTARSGGIFDADSLAKLTGLNATFGRSIDYDGGEYGNAILSAQLPDTAWIIDLAVDSLAEGRTALVVQLVIEGKRVLAVGTHLGLQPAERTAQINRLLQAIPDSVRVLLAGDFNLEPSSPNYTRLTQRFVDSWSNQPEAPPLTFPADKPERRIDYIFHSEGFECRSTHDPTEILVSTASDHRPVIADLVITRP